MSDKGITLEGLAAAVDALRQEQATWKALAHKQDQLSADQITATQSGATAAKISQIAVNTAAIQSLAAQVAGQISLEYVTTLPATGEPLTLYLVPQGDGTAPNFCNEYLWVNNAWELIGTTGAMANNGELTIQVNGVAVGTFTANQAADSAINITVPTNTNQLVNGAGYVDTAALQAALTLKQNNLNTAQLEAVNSGITAAAVQQIADNATAIAGKQDALTTAQQAAVNSGATVAKIDQIAANASAIVSLTSSKQDALSTTQLAAVNSGVTAAAVQQIGTNADNIIALGTAVASKAADADVVHLAGAETITGDKTFSGAVVTHNITPEADGTYSLGSSSYQWSAVYAQTYYYNGTAWGLDKANEWTAQQKYTGNNARGILSVYNSSYTKGSATSVTDLSIGTIFLGDSGNTGLGNSLGFISCDLAGTGNRSTLSLSSVKNEASSTDRANLVIEYDKSDTTSPEKIRCKGTVLPYSDNAYNLGTSTNRWKTLNGINPGALSLPSSSTSAYVNISSSIPDLTGTTGTYTPPADGWVQLNINKNTTNYAYASVTWLTARASSESTTGRNATVTIPVLAGVAVTLSAVGGSIAQARFAPCLGNV